MTIDDEILQIDAQRVSIKMAINSNYSNSNYSNSNYSNSKVIGDLYELSYKLRVQKVSLLKQKELKLKQKERRDKLIKINSI